MVGAWLIDWLIDSMVATVSLQDSRLSLQTVMSSPHLAELNSFAHTLESALNEVEELLDLWVSCQNHVKTDRNRCTRFRPKTKLGTKTSFYFRPKPKRKRNLSTIFGRKRNWKRKSLFSLIIQLYYININGGSCYDDLIVDVIINLYSTISCNTFVAMSSLQRVRG